MDYTTGELLETIRLQAESMDRAEKRNGHTVDRLCMRIASLKDENRGMRRALEFLLAYEEDIAEALACGAASSVPDFRQRCQEIREFAGLQLPEIAKP